MVPSLLLETSSQLSTIARGPITRLRSGTHVVLVSGRGMSSSKDHLPEVGASPRKTQASVVGAEGTGSKPSSPWSSPRPKSKCQHHLSSHARSRNVLQTVKTIVPKLTSDLYKGQSGRICVFGGCIMYTGAPYFAAISALKTGADLVHVICEQQAGQVIKSYSAELIVHPVLDTEYALEEIDQWLPRFHAVVIGPGLGRNQSMLGRISIIIEKVKSHNIPLVIDADGLWHLINSPGLIQGYKKAVLTPNAMEFSRLVHTVLKRGDVKPSSSPDPEMVNEVSRALGGVTIVHKGSIDIISNGKHTESCVDEGCPRRCGGQGDILAGSCAVFMHWATRLKDDCPDPGPGVLAGWAACRLSRACAAQAFSRHGRATTTTDLIDQIGTAFHRLFESETCI